MASLPVYLDTEQDDAAILARMKAALPADLDKAEGSFMHDSLAPAAIELAQAALWAQQVLARVFASTTFGAYLDLRAEEHGLTRRGAVAATGTVTFTGASGTVIPAGTRVSTTSTESVPAVVLTTDAEATVGVGGTVAVAVTAETGGLSGNVGAGTLTYLGSAVAGVTAVTNGSPMAGGLDQESDADLLARYLQRVRNPSSSGNIADYVAWALEVAGVGGAAVVPLWNGAGTVKVAIIDTDKAPASVTLVAAVQAYLDPDPAAGGGAAPIGAEVTVVAATAVPIDVSATLTIAPGYDAATVKAVAEDAIEAYLVSLAFATDNDVLYSRIGNAILNTPGVTDYASLLVESGVANVAIAATEVATKGTVTLS